MTQLISNPSTTTDDTLDNENDEWASDNYNTADQLWLYSIEPYP